ncbi:MAG: glycosyltransferase [Candidatus Aminicenantes bacterium]|nr:glycosyltransferase [Candidatus Aminicenantes bacterium]
MTAKVALVHDWLNGMRGGEKVLEGMLDIFPSADIFTLFYTPEKVSEKIRARTVTASYLNRFAPARRCYRQCLPLLPRAVESFDLNAYDLVVSTSHCVAKGAIPPPHAPHVSYVFTPMRYIWDQYPHYFGRTRGVKKWLIRRAATCLRTWDAASAARVDHFVADSEFVAQRIRKYYRRDATVIHPPVDTDFFSPASGDKEGFFLAVTALVPYKRVDLLVEVFNHTGDNLVIVGTGPEKRKLQRRARGNIHFEETLSRETLRERYRRARAFVHAGLEDFGIAFVESLACGTPVLASARGGVADIVAHDRTGLLVADPDANTFAAAVEEMRNRTFDPEALRQGSLRFSPEIFRGKFSALVASLS